MHLATFFNTFLALTCYKLYHKKKISVCNFFNCILLAVKKYQQQYIKYFSLKCGANQGGRQLFKVSA